MRVLTGRAVLLIALPIAGTVLLGPPVVADEFDPMAEVYLQAPLVTVALTASPPRIDGSIGVDEWNCASAVTGFFDYLNGNVLDDGPTIFLAYDPAAIHALMVVPQGKGRTLVANQTARDSEVHTDDSVELFLRTPGGDLFQIGLNPLGTILDWKNGDSSWDGALEVKAGRSLGDALPASWGMAPGLYWFVEATIPLGELGVASIEPGDTWKANFAANRTRPWACLAPTIGGSYSDASHSLDLTFLGFASWATYPSAIMS